MPAYFSDPRDSAGNMISAGGLAQFGESPDINGKNFEVSEYTGGGITTRRSVNTAGSGSVVTIGLESEINGFPLSLQEINVLALMGKTL
jgi:hypothetical protein